MMRRIRDFISRCWVYCSEGVLSKSGVVLVMKDIEDVFDTAEMKDEDDVEKHR
jgi:hypothetical protein